MDKFFKITERKKRPSERKSWQELQSPSLWAYILVVNPTFWFTRNVV